MLVVDDSAATRRAIAARLTDAGHQVEVAAAAVQAAERALVDPPQIVVTDLFMPGMSGAQLCRLLRSEKATAHVPVILLTGSSDPKTRLWAHRSGAAAFVNKSHLDELVATLARLEGELVERPVAAPVAGADRPTASVFERVSALLDGALYEAVIAGEVRAIAQSVERGAGVFSSLIDLLSQLVRYRWLALRVNDPPSLVVHCWPGARALVAPEVAATLQTTDVGAEWLEDERASDRRGVLHTFPIAFGGDQLGTLAIEASLGPDDTRMLRLVSSELGGAVRIQTLVAAIQRLATTDPLTGLANRRAFLQSAEREILLTRRHKLPFSMLLLDLDHFKRLNDGHGHAAGDDALKIVADTDLAMYAAKARGRNRVEVAEATDDIAG